MMDDLKRKRASESIGKNAKVFLKSNGWKFEGQITNCSETQIEIKDKVSNSYMIWDFDEITLEVMG